MKSRTTRLLAATTLTGILLAADSLRLAAEHGAERNAPERVGHARESFAQRHSHGNRHTVTGSQ